MGFVTKPRFGIFQPEIALSPKIDGHAFDGCSELQSVTIPDSVTEIGSGAFGKCSNLQSIKIPNGVTKIGRHTFARCTGLQSVTIPDNVTEVGSCAFMGCSGLQSVTIPDSVTKIDGHAFDGCSELQSVTISDSVTEINEYAFAKCAGLRSVTIPGGVTKIENCVFFKCSGLRSVTIADGVKEIGESTFFKCSNLRSVIISDSVRAIGDRAFRYCTGLQSVTLPDNIATLGKSVFTGCPALQSVMYKGVNIAPFINIDGYGINTFSIIGELLEHHVPLSGYTVNFGIDMAHLGKLSEWLRYYAVFGEMRLPSVSKSADEETQEKLRQCFVAQKRTKGHIPGILDKLAATVCACGIPPERLAEMFDIRYTKALLRDKIPVVPAEACRCYFDRNVCDALIRKDKIAVMAEAISFYNRSGHQECYRYLMDFIRLHPDTKTEDLLYAVDHAEEIPMRAGTTPVQIRQHRTYTENLAEVDKIETEYSNLIPGFRLSDYPCNLQQTGIIYDGMTARVLDLSDSEDIALATRLGELTNCCQCLGRAGETAMMHGVLNPDAGFWVIEDRNGTVKAQAEIWQSNGDTLVFDNIEFADTDNEHLSDRAEQLRGIIAAWAMESGYENIIMGCRYNELGVASMKRAPIPELLLTPEEVFALQEGNDARVSFGNIDEAHRYMRTEKYRPGDFVYTDAGKRCVYIKKDGVISDYLVEGYDYDLARGPLSHGHEANKGQDDDAGCK